MEINGTKQINYNTLIVKNQFALVQGPLEKADDAGNFVFAEAPNEDARVANGSDAFWFDVLTETGEGKRPVAQIRVVSYARLEVRMRMPNADKNAAFHRWGRHIRGELSDKADPDYNQACVCVMDEFHALRKNEEGNIQKSNAAGDEMDDGGSEKNTPKKKIPEEVCEEIPTGGYSGATRLFCGLIRETIGKVAGEASAYEDIPVILAQGFKREQKGDALLPEFIQSEGKITELLKSAGVPTKNYDHLKKILESDPKYDEERKEKQAVLSRVKGERTTLSLKCPASGLQFGLARKIISLVNDKLVGKVGKTWEGDGFTEIKGTQDTKDMRARAVTAAGLAAAFSYRRRGNCVHWLLMSATPFGNMVKDTVALVELMTSISQATNELGVNGEVENKDENRCQKTRGNEVQELVVGLLGSIEDNKNINNPELAKGTKILNSVAKAERMLDFIWDFEHKALAAFQGSVHSNPKVSTALPLVRATNSFMYWQDNKSGDLSIINALFGREYTPLEFEEERMSSTIGGKLERKTWKTLSDVLTIIDEIGSSQNYTQKAPNFKTGRVDLRKVAKRIALEKEDGDNVELIHPLARAMELAGNLAKHNADENQAHRPGPVLVWSNTREALPSLEEALAYLNFSQSIPLTPVADIGGGVSEIDIVILESLRVCIDGSEEVIASPVSDGDNVYGPFRRMADVTQMPKMPEGLILWDNERANDISSEAAVCGGACGDC